MSENEMIATLRYKSDREEMSQKVPPPHPSPHLQKHT